MMRRMIRVAFVVPVLGLMACSDQPTAVTDKALTRQAAIEATASQGWTFDDQLEVYGRDIPGGFAGIYVEPDGSPVLALLDDTKAADARTHLVGAGAIPAFRGLDERRVRIVKAEYGFDRLNAWHKAIVDVLGMPGVGWTDLDERRNRVVVGVTDPVTVQAVRTFVKDRGVPANALLVEPTAAQSLVSTIESDGIRPVVGGLQLGVSGCTLGFNVTHWAYGASFVTASHCPDASWGTVTGHAENQTNTSHRLGVEVIDPSYWSGSPCPSGKQCRYSDAALFQYDDTVPSTQSIVRIVSVGSKYIDTTSPAWVVGRGAYCIYPFGCPSGFVGSAVEKVGRATGLTQGTITQTCVNINASSPTITNRTHLCQFKTSAYSEAGDSGGPVYGTGGFLPGYDVVLFGIATTRDVTTGGVTFSWIEKIRDELGNPGYTCSGFLHSNGGFWC